LTLEIKFTEKGLLCAVHVKQLYYIHCLFVFCFTHKPLYWKRQWNSLPLPHCHQFALHAFWLVSKR